MPPGVGFSARYTGLLHVTTAGRYGFLVHADDGARLFVDGQLMGSGVVAGTTNNFEASTELAVGDHPLKLEYFQSGGAAGLELLWRYGDGPWQIIPPSSLTPTGVP